MDDGDENLNCELTHRSPLWMVTQEPLLDDFVTCLTVVLAALRDRPESEHELILSRPRLREVRQAWSSMIIRGEQSLHRLSELLCRRFFEGYQVGSVVFGEVDLTKERFVLTQRIEPEDLYTTADIDLGTRQLAKLRFLDHGSWSGASLIANVVEYQPTELSRLGIYKLVSRIKAEQELWNKVADEIFGLDTLVRSDKEMSHLSRYVKDVFGIKIVVGSEANVVPLHDALMGLAWSDDELVALDIDPANEARRLHLVETKDYLASQHRKASGWAAMKSVVRWLGRTFEIQIQPLSNYFAEQEYLTRESHAGFKAHREKVRAEIAKRLPLFGFYQNLLRWLFVDGATLEKAPIYPGVKVVLLD